MAIDWLNAKTWKMVYPKTYSSQVNTAYPWFTSVKIFLLSRLDQNNQKKLSWCKNQVSNAFDSIDCQILLAFTFGDKRTKNSP